MSKHTAGPWRFYDFSNDIKLNRIEIVALGKTVAHIYHSVQKEDLPNAQLIAAAPTMLDALCAILNSVKMAQTSGNDWRRELRLCEDVANHAIAVATLNEVEK